MPVLERIGPQPAMERVKTAIGSLARDVQLNFEEVYVVCDPTNAVEALTIIRDHDALRCRFFGFLSAIDWSEFGDRPGGLEVVVRVYSPDFAIHVAIHIPLEGEDPVCPSFTGIYGGALWAERETHEMFGIDFEGHPRLVNLYLPEDFEGHPLRKSFKLPSRIVKAWPGAKDPEEAAAGGR